MRLLLTSIALAAAAIAASSAGYHITSEIKLGGDGGWDYLTLDDTTHRLYISRATRVMVVDLKQGKLAGEIPDTPGVHGIAIVHAFHKGFTTNGRENKVSVFDPATLALIKKIDVGKGPDGIYYHAASKRIFTCNHGSGDITAIDAEKAEVVGSVDVKGAGEQMVTGKDGLVYVNLEDTAEVAAFDPNTLAVKHRFPIGVAKTPTGLAYDPKTNHLFIGCREKPMMVVMDAASGKVITQFPIGAGVDWAAFDPSSKLVFTSSGDGTLGIFHQKSPTEYEDAGPLKTKPSAKTMAFDPKSKKIYLPAAEFLETPPSEGKKRPTRTVKPDTFTVLILSK